MSDRFPDFLNPAIDTNGNPISGARLFFYREGTSTKKDTYSNSAKTVANANPVVADSGGRFGDIFMLTDEQYKVILADAGVDDPPASPIKTWDTVSPVRESPVPDVPVISKSSNYTVLTTDKGSLILVDASSGPVTITLPPLEDIDTGFPLKVKKVDSSANIVTIDGNLAETINSLTTVTLGVLNDSIDIIASASAWDIVGEKRLPTPTLATANQGIIINSTGSGFEAIPTLLPRSYLVGLNLSNNATDADHDVDITVGEARDSANAANIGLTSALTKQIDVSWSAGTNAGGLSSSLTLSASTVYHVFAINVGGSADVGFDTSLTAANLVADHLATEYRRIGSLSTDGSSNIIAFTQSGDEFLLDVAVQDYAATNAGTAAVLRALSVPTGIKVWAIHTITARTTSHNSDFAVLLTSPDQADTAPANEGPHDVVIREAANQPAINSATRQVRTDTSGQIRVRQNTSTATDSIFGTTHGWIDRRGQDD